MIRKLCVVLLCMQMGMTWVTPVYGETVVMPETVGFVVQDAPEKEGPNAQDEQTRNTLLYLLPSVAFAVVMTFIVFRQKQENKKK